jgi:hypothetical protein
LFWTLGVKHKHKTDKVIIGPNNFGHFYHNVYKKYLAPRRCENLNFFEIGLGCGVLYGTGHSIPLWLEYLPYSNVSVMEFSEACLTTIQSVGLPAMNLGKENERVFLFLEDQSEILPFSLI